MSTLAYACASWKCRETATCNVTKITFQLALPSSRWGQLRRTCWPISRRPSSNDNDLTLLFMQETTDFPYFLLAGCCSYNLLFLDKRFKLRFGCQVCKETHSASRSKQRINVHLTYSQIAQTSFVSARTANHLQWCPSLSFDLPVKARDDAAV